MKKFILGFMIASLVFFTNSTLAKAEPEDDTIYGRLIINVSMPTNVVGNVTLTLTNTITNEDIKVLITASQGYTYSFLAPLGTYTLKSSHVSTTDGFTLGYIATLDDFTMDMSNPNGDWSWTINPVVIDDFKGDLERKKLLEKVNSDEKKSVELPHGEEVQQTEKAQLVIDGDNAYFPSMTVRQIQEWYTNEIVSLIESGYADIDLSDFQDGVTRWADWVTRKPNSTLKNTYRARVDHYNKEKTIEIYNIQKKIYDFIRECYTEELLILDFSSWDFAPIVEQPIVEPVSEESETSEVSEQSEEKEPSIKPVAVEEPTVIQPPEKENKFLSVLKSAWFSILIIVLVAIGGIVWKIKNNKSND